MLWPLSMRVVIRRAATVLALAAATVVLGASSGQASTEWVWPVPGAVVAAEYVQPAHRFAAGHRGIDLVVLDGAVRAPASGTIAYVGDVAGRPVVTIDHGGGLVTTFEPVVSSHPVGRVVARGDAVGTLGTGGHAPPGTLHFGVRLDGDYINPRLLLGGIPRAVLLPCC